MTTDHFRELAQSSNAHLEKILRASKGPALESLVGFEWCGYNTTWRLKLLGLQKFIKGFFQTRKSVEGYNIPVMQNGLDAPWLHLPTPDNPRRFAFYGVTKVDRGSNDNFYPDAVLLDYGASPRNSAYGAERSLRDYVVQPDPTKPDLLLGKAYLALGRLRLPSNFFILEQLRPTSWKPE
jgi:hypothetical protein